LDRFVRRANINHFQDLLKLASDETERARLMKLLAEEEKKQRDAGDLPQE
jgi:hypothetical protein